MSKAAKMMSGISGQIRLGGSKRSMSISKLGAYIGDKVVEINVSSSLQLGWARLPGFVNTRMRKPVLSEAFYGSYFLKGSITWLPRDYRNRIENLRGAITRAKSELCVAKNYMPTAVIADFKQVYTNLSTQLFEVRDEILANWDTITAAYEQGVRRMIQNAQMTNAEKQIAILNLLSIVPEKEQFAEDFAVNMQVSGFPAEPHTSNSFADEVAKAWKQEVLFTAILAVESCIDEGWKRLNAAMRQIKDGRTIHPGTINAILGFAKGLSYKNIFKNRLLVELEKSLTALSNMTVEQQREQIRKNVILIYRYAKEVGIPLDMNVSAYSADELEKLGGNGGVTCLGLLSRETQTEPTEVPESKPTARTGRRTNRQNRIMLGNQRKRVDKLSKK